MFYGSILFRFVGVVFIWVLKSIYKWEIVSFKYIWNGEDSGNNDDFFNFASSELKQIFIGFIIIILIAFLCTGIFKQLF